MGWHQKVWPRFRVSLPTSNEPVKKVTLKCAQQLGFWVIPDVVKLATKLSHCSILITEFLIWLVLFIWPRLLPRPCFRPSPRRLFLSSYADSFLGLVGDKKLTLFFFWVPASSAEIIFLTLRMICALYNIWRHVCRSGITSRNWLFCVLWGWNSGHLVSTC